MSSNTNLDKGLDEIIASTGISSAGKTKARAGRGFKKSRNGPSAKTLGKAIAAAAHASGKAGSSHGEGKQNKKGKDSKAGPSAAPASFVVPGNPLASAKRVVVSNLPQDVTVQHVRQFFSDAVGKIKDIQASYRADGSPSGTYTIKFEKTGAAQRLFEKFNNQPIDNGKARLSIQILVDPTAPQHNPLQGRIGSSAGAGQAAGGQPSGKKTRAERKRGPKGAADKPLKAVADKPQAKDGKKSQNSKSKAKAKKPRRSQADLDAEMTDYFANAEKNEISV